MSPLFEMTLCELNLLQLQSERSDTIPQCHWDGCRRRSWAWCDDKGGSSKFLRHVIKHIGPEMSCMIDGGLCETPLNRELNQKQVVPIPRRTAKSSDSTARKRIKATWI